MRTNPDSHIICSSCANISSSLTTTTDLEVTITPKIYIPINLFGIISSEINTPVKNNSNIDSIFHLHNKNSSLKF